MIFASFLIDAHEGRAVQTSGVPGEYLHTSLPDDKVMRMKLAGEFLDMMCEVNLEHEKCVTYEKGKKVLYVLILKEIYGMIEIYLIWYGFLIYNNIRFEVQT